MVLAAADGLDGPSDAFVFSRRKKKRRRELVMKKPDTEKIAKVVADKVVEKIADTFGGELGELKRLPAIESYVRATNDKMTFVAAQYRESGNVVKERVTLKGTRRRQFDCMCAYMKRHPDAEMAAAARYALKNETGEGGYTRVTSLSRYALAHSHWLR